MDWLTLAAETAEHESSKTAYYILGSILAVWAVVIAFTGIFQPKFPTGKGGRAGAILITVGLVAATMVSAVVTA